ncbi:hypothetical protein Csa_012366 [Cucumis sativus]|uniref:Uncharacterized protein n=1 Tax=Cucumis sativus TaxID=3659 RepID=A0A0A0KYS7_CUCSA|nr:hypothetical protein Csa_012366 [Cucumis sativus]
MKKLQLLDLFFFVSIVSIVLLVSQEVDGRKSLLQKEGRDDFNKLVKQSTTLDADFHGEMVGRNQKKKLPTDLEDNPEDQKGENSEADEKGSEEEDVPGEEEGEYGDLGDVGDLGDCGGDESGGPGGDFVYPNNCGGEFGDDDGGALEGDDGEGPGSEESGEAPEDQDGGESGEEVSRDKNGEEYSKEKAPGDN